MSWHTGELLAFDLETTGIDPELDRIVTASVLRIDVPAARVDARTWLANPGIEIPAAATQVHGVSTEQARRDGRPADEVVYEVEQALQDAWVHGTPVVIYNAPFDLTVLDREMRRHGEPGIDGIGPVIDPLVIDKATDQYRKGSRKLTAVCAHHGIHLPEAEAHSSHTDALAAARLAWLLATCYPNELQVDLDELQQRQAGWFAEQSASFEDYLKRRKTADGAGQDEIETVVINRAWPLIPHYVTETEVPA